MRLLGCTTAVGCGWGSCGGGCSNCTSITSCSTGSSSDSCRPSSSFSGFLLPYFDVSNSVSASTCTSHLRLHSSPRPTPVTYPVTPSLDSPPDSTPHSQTLSPPRLVTRTSQEDTSLSGSQSARSKSYTTQRTNGPGSQLGINPAADARTGLRVVHQPPELYLVRVFTSRSRERLGCYSTEIDAKKRDPYI